jgi:hypothetical protein
MKAELAKVRFLSLPKYTAALVEAAAILTGLVMAIVAPSDSSKYIVISESAVGTVTEFAAVNFGVWLSTFEFSAGTMQRTLTAEPNRSRVLTDKLVVGAIGDASAGPLTIVWARSARELGPFGSRNHAQQWPPPRRRAAAPPRRLGTRR